MASSWRKMLYRKPLAVTALRGFDFDMAISDTLDRTYVPEEHWRVCISKGTVSRM